MKNELSEIEKKILYEIESRRDGCTLDILYNYYDKKELDDLINNLLNESLIYLASGMIFINYQKIKINTWINAEIIQ